MHKKLSEVTEALKKRYLQNKIRWGSFAMKSMQAIENNKISVQGKEPTKQAEERKTRRSL